ncbi:hypothetical protein GCM10009727_84040 [Actinomadura napierensis]|uniref:Methylamine utilisation protein MauE domain-containing protein n=1 Tax=Actinomadura napierensis TaxID=267854 RepID=A0ABP5M7V7_9ACTN
MPIRAAPFIIGAVAGAEFLLAALLAAGVQTVPTASAATGLFVCFACYRLLVARRTNSLMCSCAGRTRTDPATPAAMVGTTLACLIQAGLAGALLALGGRPDGGLLSSLAVVALLVPFLFVAAGARRAVRDHDLARFPEQFTSLAWFGRPGAPRTSR